MTQLPSIPPNKDKNATVDKMKELVEIWKGERGSVLDKVVTYRDLISSRLASLAGNRILQPGVAVSAPEITPIPATVLTNLVASGGFKQVFLTWDGTNQTGYSYTEIYRADTDNLGNAVLVGTSVAELYSDTTVVSGQGYYYWVRAVSRTGDRSAFNATAGTYGEAALEPDYVIDLIEEQLSENEFLPALQDRIDLIDAPSTGLIYRAGTLENQIVNILNVVQDDGTTLNQRFQQLGSSNGTVYTQDDEPTGGTYVDGDLWIDTNDGNKLYVYLGGVWSVQENSQIAALQQAVTNAQATADGKIVSFWQNDAPGTASEGDIWFDTNDGNKPYRYTGGIWESAQDDSIADALQAASDAQSTADGKIVTFYQNNAPTAQALGDLWIDTDDNNHPYRWNGSAWETVRDGTIQQAIDDAAASLAAADGNIEAFYQTTAPVGASLGDLWFDTDDGNSPYRWDGMQWVDATGSAIASALLNVQQVQDSLDGKITTFFQDSPPTANATGDLWVDTDNSNIMHRWDGASWVSIRDLGVALAVGKTKAFYSDSAPTAEAVGDLWFDTDDGNKPYYWDGVVWQELGLETVVSVDAKIIDNNQTQIGYCEIGGNPDSQYTTPQACSTAGGIWRAASPLAESVKQVTVSDGENTATIEQQFQAARNDLGLFQTSYTLKLDNNGHVSGIVLGNNGAESSMIVASDAVYFIDPTQSPTPFVPSSNYASMDALRSTQFVFGYATVEGQSRFAVNVPAYIPNATITTAQIQDAIITNAKIQDGAISTAKIGDAQVTTAKIGNAQITSAKIQDAAITNAKIGDAEIDTLKIAGNAVTLPLTTTLASDTSVANSSSYSALMSVDIPNDIVDLNLPIKFTGSINGEIEWSVLGSVSQYGNFHFRVVGRDLRGVSQPDVVVHEGHYIRYQYSNGPLFYYYNILNGGNPWGNGAEIANFDFKKTEYLNQGSAFPLGPTTISSFGMNSKTNFEFDLPAGYSRLEVQVQKRNNGTAKVLSGAIAIFEGARDV